MNDEACHRSLLLQCYVAVVLGHEREPLPDGGVVLLLVHRSRLTRVHRCLGRAPHTADDVWEREEADVVRADLIARGIVEIAQLPTAHVEHGGFALQEDVYCRVVVDGGHAFAEVTLLAQVGDGLGGLDIRRVGQLCLPALDAVQGIGAELAVKVVANQAGDGPPLFPRRGKRLDAFLL